ncbi:hypothetical protein [Microbacterium hydrocarbonoxydans]|uniref:hypothetical protein n=1 Tax=Microbacterium hydrocarbonoxydans TaxID=273678 RepID=UPI00203A4F00|nr:hypothetical protein [Microbacterium hydrocarbonoxydans]MCM3779857.1 hypothetical protein [Microbacterium hydrocarbonoxydans]
MTLSDDIANLRRETHRKGEQGIRGHDKANAYLAVQISGLWDAIALLAKAHDEKAVAED